MSGPVEYAVVGPFASEAFRLAWQQHLRRTRRCDKADAPSSDFVRSRLLGVPVLEPIGGGLAAYTPFPVAAPGDDFACQVETLLQRYRAGLLLLRRVRRDEGLGRALRALRDSGRTPVTCVPYDVAPYVETGGSWHEYYGRKNKKFRYNLRRAEKKLRELGELRYEILTEPACVAAGMDDVFDIYRERTRRRRPAGIWGDPSGQAFLRELAVRFAERGAIRLSFLVLAGERIAFCLGMVEAGIHFHYATAFRDRPELASWSPGALLLRHVLERTFVEGCRRFDMMLGDQPYKRHWATGVCPVDSWIVARRDLPARAALLAADAGLRVRQRLRQARFRSLIDRFRAAGEV